MKAPRTIKILRLMTSVIFSILHNEPLLLRGNLAQLDELGGIYIKFLQIIVINLHSTNQENFLELLAVYERSKPDQLNIQSYLATLQIPESHRLTNISSEPIGTGSFGQVYRATLDDSKPVILKILRPSVLRYIRYDLRLLSVLSRFYSLIDRQKMLNFQDIYKEFRKTCEQEVNYVREAEVAHNFYQQYIDHPHMVIPRTYMEQCTSRVIVQDYIEGLSVTDLFTYHTTHGVNARAYVQGALNSDLYVQLYTIGYELLSKALTGKLMHADPHPGNIVLLRDNKVALIDFGMTTQLHTNRMAFLDLVRQYKAYYNHDDPTIDELLVAALEFVSPKLYAAINSADLVFGSSDTTLLVRLRNGATRATQDKGSQAMINGLLKNNQIMKALFFAVNKGNRFGLTIDLQAIILLKSIHGYLSLVGPFDPECVTLSYVLNDVVDFAEANLNLIADIHPLELQPLEAVEILSNWFDKMSRNDPWLMQQIAGGYLE